MQLLKVIAITNINFYETLLIFSSFLLNNFKKFLEINEIVLKKTVQTSLPYKLLSGLDRAKSCTIKLNSIYTLV